MKLLKDVKVKNRFILSFLVLFFLSIPVLFAQEEGGERPVSPMSPSVPLRLRMESGIRAYDEGRLGDALKIFRDTAEEDTSYANAHLWIGHVFFAEGGYDAALAKYRDSLQNGRNFFPSSVRIEALYSLTETYERLEDWQGMENSLQRLVGEGLVEAFPESRRKAMVRKFVEEGPDKLLELYRLEEKAVRRAFQLQAELSLRRGEYETALENFLFSLTTILSLAIEAHRIEDPEYRFILREMNPGVKDFFTENTALLIEKSMGTPLVGKYFEDTGFFRQLFLTGLALSGMGEPGKAEDIWLLVTDHREAGIWYRFANEQLGESDLSILPTVLQHR